VQSGAGIAIVPRIAARREIEQSEIAAVPFIPRQSVEIHFVRSADQFPARLEECLEDLFRKLA
jgi:DNA-binding transcriptional LysR family regulator